MNVKFDCSIQRDGGIIAKTSFEKMRVIVVPPGTTQFFAEEMVPFDAMSLYGDAALSAFKTGMIPAGAYEFCSALLDPTSHQWLTPIVCKSFDVLSYQVPILLSPSNAAELAQAGRPIMRWTAVSPRPTAPVIYRVQVYEILQGQTPPVALRTGHPILDREVISATQLLWPPDIELPRPGMSYIWTVRASDVEGAPYGEPDGRAEPWTFSLVVRKEVPHAAGP